MICIFVHSVRWVETTNTIDTLLKTKPEPDTWALEMSGLFPAGTGNCHFRSILIHFGFPCHRFYAEGIQD